MVNETILAVIIAFVVSAVLCPIVIPILHRLKFGQQVREDGPQAHLKKQGTPTMGGLAFFPASSLRPCLYIRDYPKIIPVLFMTVGFGMCRISGRLHQDRDEAFGGLKSEPEADRTVRDHSVFLPIILMNLTGRRNRDSDSIYRRRILRLCRIWLFVPALYLRHSGNGQWRELHRWSGRSVHQRDTILVATFFTIVAIGENSGIRPDYRRGSWKPSGLSSVQCLSGAGVYGRYRITGTWAVLLHPVPL